MNRPDEDPLNQRCLPGEIAEPECVWLVFRLEF